MYGSEKVNFSNGNERHVVLLHNPAQRHYVVCLPIRPSVLQRRL